MDRLLIASVGGAICALLVVFVGFSITVAAWVPIAALAVGSTVTALVGIWYIDITFLRGKRQPVLPLLRETAPFAAMVMLAAVGAQAGVLLVEFATSEPAGGYGIAVRLSEAARVIPASVMGAFFPAMLSGAHRTDRYRSGSPGLSRMRASPRLCCCSWRSPSTVLSLTTSWAAPT